jgi:hypothetical protein
MHVICKSPLISAIAASSKFTSISTNLATDSFSMSLSINTAVAPNLIPREITVDCQISLAIEQFHTGLDHTGIKLLIAGAPAIGADTLPNIVGPNQLMTAVLV